MGQTLYIKCFIDIVLIFKTTLNKVKLFSLYGLVNWDLEKLYNLPKVEYHQVAELGLELESKGKLRICNHCSFFLKSLCISCTLLSYLWRDNCRHLLSFSGIYGDQLLDLHGIFPVLVLYVRAPGSHPKQTYTSWWPSWSVTRKHYLTWKDSKVSRILLPNLSIWMKSNGEYKIIRKLHFCKQQGMSVSQGEEHSLSLSLEIMA